MVAYRRTAGAGSRPQSAAGLEAGSDGWHPHINPGKRPLQHAIATVTRRAETAWQAREAASGGAWARPAGIAPPRLRHGLRQAYLGTPLPRWPSMSDPFELARFVEAQRGKYEQALQELTAGWKRSYWM